MSFSGTEYSTMSNTLFDLPEIVLKVIFSYLSFDEVARLRVVSKDFNQFSKQVLNKGLLKVEKFHSMCIKQVRVQLPRRESERRAHPLARHVDVLMAIETRISMLSMTYNKYIDAGLTCFIPGKVLDEILKVLRIVRASDYPPRPHEILQELRDISSMAMEHFDDKIAPVLKPKLNATSTGVYLLKHGHRNTSYLLTPRPMPSSVVQDAHGNNVDKMLVETKLKSCSSVFKKELRYLKNKVQNQSKVIAEQTAKITESEKKIKENSAKIAENVAKLAEQGTQLAELRRLIEEYGQAKGPFNGKGSKANLHQCLPSINSVPVINEGSDNEGSVKEEEMLHTVCECSITAPLIEDGQVIKGWKHKARESNNFVNMPLVIGEKATTHCSESETRIKRKCKCRSTATSLKRIKFV